MYSGKCIFPHLIKFKSRGKLCTENSKGYTFLSYKLKRHLQRREYVVIVEKGLDCEFI